MSVRSENDRVILPSQTTCVAGTKWGDFWDWSRIRTHAQSRAELESSPARVPYSSEMRIASDDSAAPGYARPIPRPLPGCLRPSSFTNRSTSSVRRGRGPDTIHRPTQRTWTTAHCDVRHRQEQLAYEPVCSTPSSQRDIIATYAPTAKDNAMIKHFGLILLPQLPQRT